MDDSTLVKALQARAKTEKLPKMVLFWGHREKPGQRVGPWVFSQWWPATFVVDGDSYTSAEHYMMAEKARLFGDEEMRAQILTAESPGKAKALGRKVRGFDQETWVANRFEIVVRGSIEKFGQDEELGFYLIGTGDRVLVEASPVDPIWGIGLAANDAGARDPAEWRGLNLLGFALMEARTHLLTRE